ncbi:MAG: Uma2 family endonuclease, partial [Myxococcota bacterium]
QYECIVLLLGIMAAWVRQQGWDERMYVGADQFFKWIPEREHNVMVSPDLYVLEPHPPSPRPYSIKTWLPGHNPPRLAVEIVSQDWRKDYTINPGRYSSLGVDELVVFDPEASRNAVLPGMESERKRVALQVYRRNEHGELVCVARGGEPVWSEVLEAWWIVVFTEHGARLCLATEPSPDALVPSPPEALEQTRLVMERVEQQRQHAEQQQQLAEQQRQHAEQQHERAERRLKEQQDENARLRAELERLLTSQKP